MTEYEIEMLNLHAAYQLKNDHDGAIYFEIKRTFKMVLRRTEIGDSMTNGTPKTLEDAIQNGIEKARMQDVNSPKIQAQIVRSHVRDFLSQKFGLVNEETAKLWKEITGEEVDL